MKDLQAKVAETTAELGVAFDGDGDRAMFVDETGALIPADFVTALFAQEILRREPGATVLFDLRSSWVCKETVEQNGGAPGMTRVGHSFIKAQMREKKAAFAGELSGHFYFRDMHYTDNAEMAMLTLLTLLSKSKKKLSELIKPFHRYYASGEINFEVDDAQATLARMEAAFKPQVKEVLHLDGLSLVADDWWANIRASNTEPVVRLNMEAKTQGRRDAMLAALKKTIGGKPAKGH
jgi:phosphomannomutase